MIYLRCSDIARFIVCPKQSKLRSINNLGRSTVNRYTEKGKEMHTWYSRPFKEFNRLLLMNKLGDVVLERSIDNIVLRGKFDDLRILLDYRNSTVQKVVSLVEVKTTSRNKLYSYDIGPAILQLQLYVWLIEPYLLSEGYRLHNRHYVEIYNQNTGYLMKRVPVQIHPDIPRFLHTVVDTWNGLLPMKYPDKHVCKFCPREIRKECSYYGYT